MENVGKKNSDENNLFDLILEKEIMGSENKENKHISDFYNGPQNW